MSQPGAEPENEHPLVSCIMPTYNRRRFVPQAIKYFVEQDYPSKELIIVDDGTDAVGDLVPNDPRLIYIRLEKRTSIGAKRNLAIEQSHADIILHLDDDDWQARHRIRYQVEHLTNNEADVCGNRQLLFYDLRKPAVWLYTFPTLRKTWLAGETLCYTKSFWAERKFDDSSVGEDSRFIWKNSRGKMLELPAYSFCVAMIHPHNICPKSLTGPCWSQHPEIDIKNILKEDWEFYTEFSTAI